MRFILFFLLLAFSLEGRLSKVENFLKETLSSESILNRRQIKIPGYSRAYNPSLIPYKEGYLLSFRYVTRCPDWTEIKYRTDLSFIGVAQLDENFQVIEPSVQLLNILSHSSHFSLTAEDGRLLNVNGRIFLFFNDFPLSLDPTQFGMYFGELIEKEGVFALKEAAKPLYYPAAIPVEKNWSPFVSKDRLYVIYSDQPRVILEVEWESGFCHEAARTLGAFPRDLGEIRGGTPAYASDPEEGAPFLTFFHSSFPAKTGKGKAYVMGAYTFDKEPPFTIQKRSERPLGHLADYTEENSAKVMFPGGMVVFGNHIHVAWGKGDREIWITTFDREKLLSSLK